MKHVLAAAARRLHASKGDVFNIGDRVAGDLEDGWFLGTVIKAPAGKLGILYDAGDKEFFPVKDGQTDSVILLPAGTPKNRKPLSKADIRQLRQKQSTQVKSPKPPSIPRAVTKPLAQPKKSAGYEWMDSRLWTNPPAGYDEIMKDGLTEAAYDDLPFLGQQFSTGRYGSPTGRATYVGFAVFKNRLSVMAWSVGGQALFYTPKSRGVAGITDEMNSRVSKEKTGTRRLGWADFRLMRRDAAASLGVTRDKQKAQQDKSRENFDKFREQLVGNGSSYDPWRGKYALINFSNGQFSKEIQGLDWQNSRIAISGSGTKLRWIPLSMVEKITDTRGGY